VKILHLITGLDIGGAEMMLYRLCQQQIMGGDVPYVVSLKSNGNMKALLLEQEIPVYELGFPKGSFSFPGFKSLVTVIREANPDVIHCWMYHANLIGSFASLITGNIPVIWAIHNTTLSVQKSSKFTLLIMRLLGLISFLPKQIVYCSLASKKIHEKYFYTKSKGKFIPNGVDTCLFSPNKEKRSTKIHELQIDQNQFIIGMIGRYDPQKDYPNFVRAANIIMQGYKNIQFIMCGPGVNESNQELMELISTTYDPTKYHLIGSHFDIENVHNCFDLFILTSSYGEAFPIVLTEAMACEVPCISTDVGDASFIIGETGLVVPIKNPQAIADAVEHMLSLPNVDFSKLKEAARNRIVEHFSLSRISQTYKETYQSIIEKE
jgi:glycosyltransferase involved in cell wall biosynthesis